MHVREPNEAVVPAEGTGGLRSSLLEAMEAAGGLWQAADHYATPSAIVEAVRANDVRALRLDARDVSFLADLDLEFLHLRSDGRPPLDPIRHLKGLRALIIEVGALRGEIDLAAHPRLEWLKLKLSGKGGAANVPRVLAGHPGLQHLQLGEVPFEDLSALAAAFPNLRSFGVWGADRMRCLGDLGSWTELVCLGATFAGFRSLDGIEILDGLEYAGFEFNQFSSTEPLAALTSLRYLSVIGSVPPLKPLEGHTEIRIAQLSMPADEDLSVLRTWPALVALGGKRWIGAAGESPVPGVPFLADLENCHPLCEELWRANQAGGMLV